MVIMPKQLQWPWPWTVDHHHPRRHPLLMQLQLHFILCFLHRCYHLLVQRAPHPRLHRRPRPPRSNLPTWSTVNTILESILPIFKIQTRLRPLVSEEIDPIFFYLYLFRTLVHCLGSLLLETGSSFVFVLDLLLSLSSFTNTQQSAILPEALLSPLPISSTRGKRPDHYHS